MADALDVKQIFTIAVSSTMVAIITYYFVPGAGSAQTALWYGLANAVVEVAATLLVQAFF